MGEPAPALASVRAELRRGVELLTEAGCDTPRIDAELLLAAALSVDRAGLYLRSEAVVSADFAGLYGVLLERRAAREPIAYILGEKGFRRLTLAVDARVLIPRPETELLVEVGLSLPSGACVADVGTGSGAVALALKDERHDLCVIGIDVSDGALAVARANGARLGIDVSWVCSDLLDTGEYDAVLANLPYVCDGEELMPDVAMYEPAGALFGGGDGLSPIRRLIDQLRLRSHVRLVALEVGEGQAGAVSGLVRSAGFEHVQRLRDLAGIERVVAGRRS